MSRQPNSRRISVRRIVCASVAVLLIVAAVYFAFEYRRVDRAFYDWIDARPATLDVDLSRPGRFTAPFHQTCQTAHSEAFYLTLNPPADQGNAQLLQGLDGSITIHNADGREIRTLKMASKTTPDVGADQPIMLASFFPFEKGEYTVTIDVRSGAAALDGREQSVHAAYHLCGLERVPATVAGFLAFVCGILGLTAGIVATDGFIRHGLPKAKCREAGGTVS